MPSPHQFGAAHHDHARQALQFLRPCDLQVMAGHRLVQKQGDRWSPRRPTHTLRRPLESTQAVRPGQCRGSKADACLLCSLQGHGLDTSVMTSKRFSFLLPALVLAALLLVGGAIAMMATAEHQLWLLAAETPATASAAANAAWQVRLADYTVGPVALGPIRLGAVVPGEHAIGQYTLDLPLLVAAVALVVAALLLLYALLLARRHLLRPMGQLADQQADQQATIQELRRQLGYAQNAGEQAELALREQDRQHRLTIAAMQTAANAAAQAESEMRELLTETHTNALAAQARARAEALLTLEAQHAEIMADLQAGQASALAAVRQAHLDRLAALRDRLRAYRLTPDTEPAAVHPELVCDDGPQALSDLPQDLDDLIQSACGALIPVHDPFDLTAVIDAAMQGALNNASQLGLPATVTLTPAQPPTDPVWLLGDPQRLRRALCHLLMAALRRQPDALLELVWQAAPGMGAPGYATLGVELRKRADASAGMLPVASTGLPDFDQEMAEHLLIALGAAPSTADGLLDGFTLTLPTVAPPLAAAQTDHATGNRSDHETDNKTRPAGMAESAHPGLSALGPRDAGADIVDWVSGRRRAGDDAARYSRVLQAFQEETGTLSTRLRAQVSAGDWAAAARIAHGFRGVAGTIGAHASLLQRAQRCEEACARMQPKENHMPSDQGMLAALATLEALENALPALLTALQAYLAEPIDAAEPAASLGTPDTSADFGWNDAATAARLAAPASRPTPGQRPRVPGSPARQRLLHLRDLLAAGDSAALEWWVTQAESAAASLFSHGKVAQIVSALDRFAFSDALNLLEDALGRHPSADTTARPVQHESPPSRKSEAPPSPAAEARSLSRPRSVARRG